MYLDKSIGITGKSLIIAYLIVNFFNLIPIRIFDAGWLILVCSLIVDSASLLLIGIFLLINRSHFRIENLSKNNPEKNYGDLNEEYKWNKNYIIICNFISYFFTFIIILQIPIFINGFNDITFNINQNIDAIENSFNNFKEKITNEEFESEVLIEKDEIIEKAKLNKQNQLNNINKSKNVRMNDLLKNVFRVIALSLIWSYAFRRLAKF